MMPAPWWRPQRPACVHAGAAPDFDEDEARGMTAEEVVKRWPRGTRCPVCGATGAFYASWAHFIAGDW